MGIVDVYREHGKSTVIVRYTSFDPPSQAANFKEGFQFAVAKSFVNVAKKLETKSK